MKWAILDNSNKVIQIVEQANRPSNGVKGNDPSCKLGYYYNGWTFDAPQWTSYEFLNRFTKQERKKIITKAKTDDDVADFQLLCTTAQEVRADDPTTIAGMDYLVLVGIIDNARKNQILGG